MIEELFVVLAAIAIFLVVTIAVAVPVNMWDEYQCKSYHQVTGRQTKHVSFDACYIENESGEFMTKKEYLKYKTAGSLND